jgi:hypothetical protein
MLEPSLMSAKLMEFRKTDDISYMRELSAPVKDPNLSGREFIIGFNFVFIFQLGV